MATQSSRVAALLAVVAISSNAYAQMGISVLNAQYETDLLVTQFSLPDKPLNKQSATPISNELTLAGPQFKSVASASADTFSVSTSTSAFDGRARATGLTWLTFSPIFDGVAPLTLEFSGTGAAQFSNGRVSLFDLTTNQALFDYSWNWPLGENTVPGWQVGTFHALFDVNKSLFDSHDYAFSLRASTNASSDAQGVSIRLGGLEVVPMVPEPETWAMMLLGLGFVGYTVNRRKRA